MSTLEEVTGPHACLLPTSRMSPPLLTRTRLFVNVKNWLKNLPANARDPGLIPVLGNSPGEGNGTPLQYPCLENSMDRGAWRATVHGVAKSQTGLSDLHFYFQAVLRFPSREGHPGEARWPVFSEEAVGGESWTLTCWDWHGIPVGTSWGGVVSGERTLWGLKCQWVLCDVPQHPPEGPCPPLSTAGHTSRPELGRVWMQYSQQKTRGLDPPS